MCNKQDTLMRCKVAFAEERLQLLLVTEDAERLARLLHTGSPVTKEDQEIIEKYVDSKGEKR